MTWLAAEETVVVALEAVETADCAAELAVETTECVVELAVDTALCTVDDTALVTLEVETGGEGTETDGSPEARLEDAPEPTMAAGANVRTQIRISDFARFIESSLDA